MKAPSALSPRRKPRVLLAGMGGTIAIATGRDGVSVVGSSANDLLAGLVGSVDIADVHPMDVRQRHGRAITPEDMCALAHELVRAFHEGCEGAVVTHGTDTLEETAYALALQVPPGRSIAITGAMRSPAELGADGAANLDAALRVAASPAFGDVGPVVVMQNEIHLARWVTKSHTAALGAFSSPGRGPIGTIVEARPQLECLPTTSDFIGLAPKLDRRVELIWVTAGADGESIDAAVQAADGLVIAGTGGGHVPPAMVGSIRSAVEKGVPVVLASRTGSGPLLRATYGGAGSETELEDIGVIVAGTLAPVKARLRLLVGLALDMDPRKLFPI